MVSETLHSSDRARAVHGHQEPGDSKVFDFWIYLMSDCIIFATLFATYFLLFPSASLWETLYGCEKNTPEKNVPACGV